MSEAPIGDATPSAGRLLREARQAQGLHIAALASTIKVAPRKLELLEADRIDELPDATFTRALAHTVCRALKIDPVPVLERLPRREAHRLADVGEGLNAPFRARPVGTMAHDDGSWWRPAVWGPLGLLVVAGMVYLLPAGWLPAPPWRHVAAPATMPAATVAGPGDSASAPIAVAAAWPASAGSDASVEGAASGSAQAAVATGSPAAETSGTVDNASAPSASVAAPVEAAAPAGAVAVDDGAHALVVQVTGDSWIEVVDGTGKALLARTVKAGESIGLDGAVPLRLRIGNAPATAVTFRGHAVALGPYTRDNLARLELR